MAATTLITRHGTKVRTGSARRFVVIYDCPERPKATGVEYRTDDPGKALSYVASHGRTFREVFDTTTGAAL